MGAQGGSPLSLRERKMASEIGGDRFQQLAVRWAELSVGLVERALRLTAAVLRGRKGSDSDCCLRGEDSVADLRR
jgi:hypothetical protein